MSFSLNATFNKSKLASGLEAVVEQPPAIHPAQTELVNAAKKAVVDLAKAVAGDADYVAVSINGHSNKDHKPTAGYANEMVTVSVSQVAKSGA